MTTSSPGVVADESSIPSPGIVADESLIPTNDTTRGWWEATRERRLVLQTCESCGHRQHRPRAICTACGSLDLGWSAAIGTGTLLSRTVVHRSPDPDRAPGYVVAIVTLDEGPTMLTNLVGDDAATIPLDSPVRVDWQPLLDGRALPVFRATT